MKKEGGIFLSKEFLETCIMSDSEYAEVKSGNCPYCHKILVEKSSNSDVKIMHCEECNKLYLVEA